MLKELTLGQRFQLRLCNNQTATREILRGGHRIIALKLQDNAVLVKPTVFNPQPQAGSVAHPDRDVFQRKKPLGKIRLHDTGDLSPNAASLDDARYHHIFEKRLFVWWFTHNYSRIS